MSEPFMKQIVDLKDEHSLMLEALKMVEWLPVGEDVYWLGCPWCSAVGYEPQHAENCVRQIAIKAAEEGNQRRLEKGNVELP